MSNPYRPVYTADQDVRVRDGRKRLRERWAAPKFSAGQAPGFAVEYARTEIEDGGRVFDVFVARNASPSFAAVWATDLATLHFAVEHGARQFDVRVPHTYYLRARWLPVSVDRGCALETFIQLAVILTLLYVAFLIGFLAT